MIRLRPSSNVPLPTPLPLPKGAQLKVYWSTSSPPAPVTSFIKMPLSNQLVSEMLVTLTDLHTPMSAVPRFTSGRKALRSGEYEYRPMEPSTPAPTPSAAPFMNSRLSISSLLLNQSESCARQRQQGHDGEVGDHAHDEADDHASAAKSSAVLNSRRQPGQPSMNHQLISQMLISQIMGIMGNCCGCEKPFWVPSTKWAYL